MEFCVLGPLEVRDGGRVLDIGPRMPRAVLAALLLDPGRAVSLDRLMDALWGESPPAGALGALQVYVSNLRRVLEPERPARAQPTVLVTQPPGYALRVDADAIDARRFAALVAGGRTRYAAGDLAGAADVLRQALGLWRGEPYADLAGEPFLQAEIARLTELRAGAQESLAEAELALGGHAAIVADLEHLAAVEPIRERRWELLALALYRSGRQTEALRVLQHARRTFVEELGIEPGGALRRLEQDIFQQAPSLDWQPPAAAAPARAGGARAGGEPGGPARPRARPSRPAGGQPLVGRDRELAQLQAALEDAIGGCGHVALISGEPGIGKTRLAEELSADAWPRGVHVAWGRAPEGEAAPAYWPWVQIVRALVTEREPDAVLQALGADAAELARLVPEVKEVAGRDLEPPPEAEPETARTRLYDAVVGFILRSAAVEPLLLVVDDLHAADLPTLQLVQLVAGRLADAPVLLVTTYREHEAALSRPVVPTLAALARVRHLLRVRLGGLSDDDVRRLVVHATGSENERVADAICARSEGNPFFVSELIQLLRDSGDDVVGSDVPSGVRDVIRQRLARLPEASSAVLAAAAVAGRSFELPVVATAAGLDGDRALEHVESALQVGVVAEDGDAVGSFRFSHSLVRETVYDGLSGMRRARLHHAVGTALARTVGSQDDRAAEIADHFLAGVAAGDADEAFAWAIRAADQAALVLAFEQAEELLNRAADLARRASPAPEAWTRELAARRRMASVLLMKHWYAPPVVGEAWSRAAELSEQVEGSPEVLTVLWGAWSYHYVRCDLDRALELAHEMLARSERADDAVLRVVGDHCAGIVYTHRGQLDDAVKHLRGVDERVGELPPEFHAGIVFEPDVRIGHHVYRGLIEALSVGAEAERTLAQGLAAARGIGRPLGVVEALIMAALGRVLACDRDGAEARAGEAVDLSDEHGFRLLGAMADVVRQWARADADALHAALDAFLGTGSRMMLHLFWGLLADVERGHGRREAALAAVDRGLAEAGSTGERFWEPELHRLRGELLVAGPAGGRGDEAAAAEAADASFQAGLALARAMGARVLEARLHHSRDRAVQA